MNRPSCLTISISVFICCILVTSILQARPDASVKFSVIRQENPNMAKETLILPYAFPSETMGTTFGVGGLAKGYHQDQLLFGGTIFGSVDDAKGIIGGMWDYRLPWTQRCCSPTRWPTVSKLEWKNKKE